jgi:hypothetical protein
MIFSGQFNRERWFQTWKDGEIFSPARSLKIRNHSPDGFAWGYCGSGPAQLALGILLEVTDQATAELLYQDFKRSVVSMLPSEDGSVWKLTSKEVEKWLQENRTCLNLDR